MFLIKTTHFFCLSLRVPFIVYFEKLRKMQKNPAEKSLNSQSIKLREVWNLIIMLKAIGVTYTHLIMFTFNRKPLNASSSLPPSDRQHSRYLMTAKH